MKQKVKYGLRDVVYAVLNEETDIVGGAPLYGTIYPLPGAVEMSFDPASSITTLFADDGPDEAAESIGEMKMTLNIKDLLPEDEARLLGHTYNSGQIVHNTQDQSKYIALGAKITMTGDTSVYIWFYKVKLNKPAMAEKTKEASIEFRTPTFEGRVLQLVSSKNYLMKVRTDDPGASATLLSNFFTQVTLPSANLSALQVDSIELGTGDDLGKVIINFVKADASSFSLNTSTVTADTIVIFKSAVVPGTFAVGGAGTTIAVKFTPETAFDPDDVVGVAVSGVRDNSNIEVTTAGANLVVPT